jgi:hypothetical protein
MPTDHSPPAATASLCRGFLTRGALALGVLRLNAGFAAALGDLFAVLIQFVEKIIVSGHRITAEGAEIFGHRLHG